jgi:para-aminobenzoate synthetase / 4-amino-4-deoxychorismate lyase
MPLRGNARPVRIPLEGAVSAAEACLLLRGDRHPFALAGAWADRGALIGSEPVRVADTSADPFSLLGEQPAIEQDPTDDVVGGGWFGYLGYGLGARLEPVPPSPPRLAPLPSFALAFYDHLLRMDATGRWWFEALWTDEREAALTDRLGLLRARLAAGVRELPVRVGEIRPAPPGAAGHLAAVEACRERIGAGEISQANLCFRLEGRWEGDPLDLFGRTARRLRPGHAALVAGPWGSLCSLSPELFLRRRGRRVTSEPIEGMALGDADLVRASFPPGSVTGAPKIQAMRVIAELESSAREAYGGAIGYASPLAGLELNVAIRTLEARGERIWLGAGGGVVADSDPESELETSLAKARPVIAAAGARLDEPPAARPTPLADVARSVPGRALTGAADRPDPALGVFSTLLARDGVALDAGPHLARLRQSAEELYAQRLPEDLEPRIAAAVAGRPLARMRVLVAPGPGSIAIVELETTPLGGEPQPEPAMLAPAYLPGGLGSHKWRDRRLLDHLERNAGALPLIVDLDGQVLEAAIANVLIVEGATVVTPPLDGRLLPGTIRGRVLAAAPSAGLETREEPITLERLEAADEVLLSSAIRGVRPAVLGDERSPRFEVGSRLHEALRMPDLVGAR